MHMWLKYCALIDLYPNYLLINFTRIIYHSGQSSFDHASGIVFAAGSFNSWHLSRLFGLVCLLAFVIRIQRILSLPSRFVKTFNLLTLFVVSLTYLVSALMPKVISLTCFAVFWQNRLCHGSGKAYVNNNRDFILTILKKASVARS